MSDLTWEKRLEMARQLLDARDDVSAALPIHVRDQLAAAARDTKWRFERLDPDGTELPYRSTGTREGHAYLVAAMLDCEPCPHLRNVGYADRPTFALLPLRRLVCERCVRTVRRPPPDEDDRCDVCGARGVRNFKPFVVHDHQLIFAGDACRHCAEVAGAFPEVPR